jgi:hypothetical protein
MILEDYLNSIANHFVARLLLIDPNEAKWMQYVAYSRMSIRGELVLTLKFRTSNLGIGFDLDIRLQEPIHEELFYNHHKCYLFFKNLKISNGLDKNRKI